MHTKQSIEKLYTEYITAYNKYMTAINKLPHVTIDGVHISIQPLGTLSFEDNQGKSLMILRHTTLVELKKLLDTWLA